MKYIKIVLPFLFIILSAKAFAAAGFADCYYDHQHWIFPAYAYCLGFGLVILLIMTITSLFIKTKTKSVIRTTSTFLKEHAICGIIVAGILWAIILGIIGAVSWEIIGFLIILPFLATIYCFPFVLANKKIREKWLLSPIILKWTAMIVISAIISSVIFIILTNFGVLKGTDITYLARPDRIHHDFYSPTHPYDSMKEIWEMPLFFMAEIIIAIFLYYLGMLNRYLCVKLSAIRKKKRFMYSDIYTEE